LKISVFATPIELVTSSNLRIQATLFMELHLSRSTLQSPPNGRMGSLQQNKFQCSATDWA